MTTGEKLQKLRKENNFTQEDLADILSVSRQTIYNWESNNVYPETEKSETADKISLEVKKNHVNLIDAIAHGASDGMKISINVIRIPIL